jgi:hypothetical protein
VLGAAGETETTQENIQDWLQLAARDPGFQLLTEEEIATVIFFISFSSELPLLLNFPLFLFSVLFCLSGPSFASLIRVID